MADNHLKTPLAQSLNSVSQQRADDAIQLLGKNLPCRIVSIQGQMVTVAFELGNVPFTLPQVTMPIHTSAYDWLPLQVGDKGNTVAGDVYLGGISGLGGGTANLSQRGNLSTLWFVPIANKSWTTPNPNQRVMQGPEGAVIQDTGGKTVVNVGTAGITIGLTTGAIHITGGNITIVGDVIADGISLKTHVHSGVMAGGDDTGPPVS